MFVRVSWVGYDDAGERVLRHLRYDPITEYQAAVDWAVSMADQMAHPRVRGVAASAAAARNTLERKPRAAPERAARRCKWLYLLGKYGGRTWARTKDPLIKSL